MTKRDEYSFLICAGFCIFIFLPFYPPKMVFINCVCVSMQWCSLLVQQTTKTYNALNEDFSFVCSFASAFSNSIKIVSHQKPIWSHKHIFDTLFSVLIASIWYCINVFALWICVWQKLSNLSNKKINNNNNNTVVSKRALKNKSL